MNVELVVVSLYVCLFKGIKFVDIKHPSSPRISSRRKRSPDKEWMMTAFIPIFVLNSLNGKKLIRKKSKHRLNKFSKTVRYYHYY